MDLYWNGLQRRSRKVEWKSKLETDLLLPMCRCKLLWIKHRRIQLHIRPDIGVILGKNFASVPIHFYACGNPRSRQRTIMDESNIVDFVWILARRLDHSQEQQTILRHPELL